MSQLLLRTSRDSPTSFTALLASNLLAQFSRQIVIQILGLESSKVCGNLAVSKSEHAGRSILVLQKLQCWHQCSSSMYGHKSLLILTNEERADILTKKEWPSSSADPQRRRRRRFVILCLDESE
jgi:hypothetical protein